MINIIKRYHLYSKNKNKDYWYKGTLFEMIRMLSKVESYEILCFDKKKILKCHKTFFNDKMENITKEILQSHMVIIRIYSFEKNIIMRMLGRICKENNCFGPIVFTEDQDILFFPKLSYQDGYLLKSIIEKYIGNKNFCIAYGSNKLLII